MKEFGSDFHYLPIGVHQGRVIGDYYPHALYYAVGRHALVDLYRRQGWKNLWVPEFFCYDVLSSMENEGVNLKFYPDYPLSDERDTLLSLPFESGDALLRVNYYGLRSWRSNEGIPVPVVEDHTHDLIGEWATNSEADWCVASLRKTLPIAEGGILWSPKGLMLPPMPELSQDNSALASTRWSAMRQKSLYLENKIEDKSEFLAAMVSTEEEIDTLPVSAIDNETTAYLAQFDISHWYNQKITNRAFLRDACPSGITILEPEGKSCNPFSMTLLFKTESERDAFRKYLIGRSVYPAILWCVPETKSPDVKSFSRRMLSMHCDGRYNMDAMMQLRDIIAAY